MRKYPKKKVVAVAVITASCLLVSAILYGPTISITMSRLECPTAKCPLCVGVKSPNIEPEKVPALSDGTKQKAVAAKEVADENLPSNEDLPDALAKFNFGPPKTNFTFPAVLTQEELDQIPLKATPNPRCPQKYGSVAIFLVYTNKAAYVDATNTLRCYAESRGYPVFLVHAYEDVFSKKYCSHVRNVFYRKHCLASLYVQKVRWLVVSDGDTAVINGNHCMEEFIDDEAEVLLYERFFSGEMTSGNYMVKNTPKGRQFLMDWVGIENEGPPSPYFFSADNGALHIALLRAIAPTDYELHKSCAAYIRHSIWPKYEPGYGRYVGCTKKAFQKFQRDDAGAALVKVRIFPRAQGWVRDMVFTAWQYYEGDFMCHGIKHPDPLSNQTVQELQAYKQDVVPDVCKKPDWMPLTSNMMHKRNITVMKKSMKSSGHYMEGSAMKPVFAKQDFHVCWPHCPPFFKRIERMTIL